MKTLVCGLALALLAAGAGCGASIKDIEFNVNEGGHPVPVKKFYNDGFGGDSPEAKAFKQTQKGDLAGGKATLEAEIAKNPKNVWAHYDLGILHEAGGEWDKAEAEMKTAQELDPKDSRFPDELKFIAAHKGK